MVRLKNSNDDVVIKINKLKAVNMNDPDALKKYVASVDSFLLSCKAPVCRLKKKYRSKKKEKSTESRASKAKKPEDYWLRPNIRVRVVSKKSFRKGRYYNKKGTIVDVVALGVCVVKMDGGALLEGNHKCLRMRCFC